jgi:hypothetical protein
MRNVLPLGQPRNRFSLSRPFIENCRTARPTLFLVQIFARYMVLRHLVRANSLLVSVVSAFDTSDDVGFKPDAVCSRLCFDRIRVDQMTYLRVGSDEAG